LHPEKEMAAGAPALAEDVSLLILTENKNVARWVEGFLG